MNAALEASAHDPEVVGYKSIACYRTGLDITVNPDAREIHQELTLVMLRYETTKELRLAYKPLNDFVVNTVLRISEQCGKPGGDHDTVCSPFDTDGQFEKCNSIPDSETTISPLISPRLR